MFLPINKKDMNRRGWKSCEFILISGDAYVDHPSFGTALIARMLEEQGYRVGIIAQPQNEEDYHALGAPETAWLISSGNMDSMVNRYTANRKYRAEDLYSPGGKAGLRPDRALIPYTSMARKAAKGVPVILGGIEASLRRLTHYDYWSDKLRRSILLDSKADMLVYGMAERPLKEVCRRLSRGITIEDIQDIAGTVTIHRADLPPQALEIPSYESMLEDKLLFASAYKMLDKENNPFSGKVLYHRTGQRVLRHNPPSKPLDREELDRLYSISFERKAHPSYKERGDVPALKEVLFSLTSSRGCFGACSFCAIALHQGEIVQSRSEESLLSEAERLTKDKRFKGIIHDVGGPTANFRNPSCKKQGEKGSCSHRKCLFPKACSNLDSDHSDYRSLMEQLRHLPGVRKIFIRSGIRYDYLLQDDNNKFLEDLCSYHVSGQLKVAPEHASPEVLKRMGKPKIEEYKQFKKSFDKMNQKVGKKQFLIPYLIASHPGTSLKEGIEMALFLRDTGFIPDQVQDFYPTPGTLSSVMYYTGIDPRNNEKVHIPKGDRERAMLRALMQYNRRENHKLVREALRKAGRTDLIGFGPKALVPPSERKNNKKRRK